MPLSEEDRGRSLLLGFAAPSAFSRWFADQYGASPRGWRETSGAGAAATSLPGPW